MSTDTMADNSEDTFTLQGGLRNRQITLKQDPQGFVVIDGRTITRMEFATVGAYSFDALWDGLRGLTCFLAVWGLAPDSKETRFEFWRPRDKSKNRSFRLKQAPTDDELQVSQTLQAINRQLQDHVGRILAREFMETGRCEWTPGVMLNSDRVTFTDNTGSSSWSLADIDDIQILDARLYISTVFDPRPVLNIPTSAANFYPGYKLFQELLAR